MTSPAVSVTAPRPVAGTADTRNTRLAEMAALLVERREAWRREVTELDRQATAEGKPGLAAFVTAAERMVESRGDDGSARRLMVSESAEHGRWCALCGADLPPGCGVVRKRVFLGYGIGGGYRWTVAPVCATCAQWWSWEDDGSIPPCTTCRRPVVDLARTARRHWRPTCCAACARAAINAERRERRGERACSTCGTGFTPSRADAAYCSSACRQRAYRGRRR